MIWTKKKRLPRLRPSPASRGWTWPKKFPARKPIVGTKTSGNWAAATARRRQSSPIKWWPTITESNATFRSEEHTSELQSRGHLVCRLLLEKKKRMIKKKEVTVIKSGNVAV